jgi:2-isopropylmalate synthase
MKKIVIADTTLCREKNGFSFKEKIEIARQLEKLNVGVIELAPIEETKTDILLVRTVASFVKSSVLSVAAGLNEESITLAAEALSTVRKPSIRIELPVSPVGMEYTCHKKAPKMLEWISFAVKKASALVSDVEFCAVDATRAEQDFLTSAINAAVEAGAKRITVCDTAGEMLPDDFAAFTKRICDGVCVPVGVKSTDRNGLACAQAILAVRNGASAVKTAVGGDITALDTFCTVIKNCGESYSLSTDIRYTELNRTVKQINWIADNAKNEKSVVTVEADTESIRLDKNDTRQTVIAAVTKLGYDLSEEDCAKVYEEFLRVASKKNVGAKELDAIVASAALQVPATYKLKSYVINNGNIITASANITLERDGNQLESIEIGDGPIDAAFLAIDKIIGAHYELDDFQIQAVTEGTEAMGSAVVKLRSGGKVYSGNGISTDIIGASIRAYLNAINKIVYEEA